MKKESKILEYKKKRLLPYLTTQKIKITMDFDK